MRRVIAAFLIAVAVLVLRATALTADGTAEETAERVEAAFRSAMEAWAYEEFWRLWEMGTGQSRFAFSREEFTDSMRRGNTRPAAGKQVEATRMISLLPDSALIYVKLGLEDRRRALAESIVRPFLLRNEDGEWKVSLWDFVGLAQYFPPEFLNPPPVVPPPNTPRPKRMRR